LRTESSARYERGVNFAELETACQRAIALIVELAGAAPTTQIFADTRPDLVQAIELRLARIHQVLGNVQLGDRIGPIPTEDVRSILTSLGFAIDPQSEGTWRVTVPPYRARDIEREIDLIEEIARVYGYDRFCDTLPAQSAMGCLSAETALTRQLRDACRAAGLTELIHYTLVKPGSAGQICLVNPLFAEYSALRTEVLPALIDAFAYNLQQGNGPLNGFEIGRVFWQEGEALKERDEIAGILGGDPIGGHWTNSGKARPMSWFEAKGVLDSIFQRLGVSVQYQADSSDARLHPGRTAALRLQGKALGFFGQLHPQLCREKDLPDEVYVFQFDLGVLLGALAQPSLQVPRFKSFSSYPASDRDLAFFAPTTTAVAELEKVMGKAGGKLLESVQVFDEYRGENVPDGQRSLAFRLVYRAGDRTLTDKEVDEAHQSVRNAIVKQFGVVLRS
jgi:phenylalanyl-tRNA synthetase beta chain